MSNDLVDMKNQLPEDIRKLLAQQVATDISRLGAIGGKDAIRITQDKKFETPDGVGHDELHVIVVDFVYRNEYYLSNFNRKQLTPPACFAISAQSSDLKPSSNSPMRQSDSCSMCQQNQFGSSPNGDGKACKNTVFLAVLPPDATAETPIWVLKTSPTAIKHFNSYVAKIARGLNAPVSAVVTKLYFDPSSTYASVRFDVVEPNSVFELTLARHEEARHRLLQEPDVSTFEIPGKK